MRKKILCLLLVVLLAAGTLPLPALAAGTDKDESKTTIVFSATVGTESLLSGSNGTYVFAPQEVTIPYFDLALYDLESIYYNPDCYGHVTGGDNNIGENRASQIAGDGETADGVVTTLHAMIYLGERYILGYSEEDAGTGKSLQDGLFDKVLSFAGSCSPGSIFIDLWDRGTNLNYYLDYEYPLGAPGWGSTADQQALTDGMHLNIHFIATLGATGTNYGFFAVDNDTHYDKNEVVDMVSVPQGRIVPLTLYKTVYGSNYTTDYINDARSADVFWLYDMAEADISDWDSSGFYGSNSAALRLDQDGHIVIDTESLAPGCYYLAVKGTSGGSLEHAPAVFALTVTEPERVHYGDVNGDNTKDVIDAGIVRQYAAGKSVSLNLASADVNGDGKVDVIDAGIIQQYAAGRLAKFPAE